MPNHVIDPSLPQELATLLDDHEIPHTEGAILWELEKRGFQVRLEGPFDPVPHKHLRWRVLLIGADGAAVALMRGQTARIALARALDKAID